MRLVPVGVRGSLMRWGCFAVLTTQVPCGNTRNTDSMCERIKWVESWPNWNQKNLEYKKINQNNHTLNKHWPKCIENNRICHVCGFIFMIWARVANMVISLFTQLNWQRSQLLLFWCFLWAGARVPAEALVWTAGPSDPSSLLLNWF